MSDNALLEFSMKKLKKVERLSDENLYLPAEVMILKIDNSI